MSLDGTAKRDVVYMYNGILFSHIKGRYPPMYENIKGPLGHYAKQNKPEERQISYDLIYDSRYFHPKCLS